MGYSNASGTEVGRKQRKARKKINRHITRQDAKTLSSESADLLCEFCVAPVPSHSLRTDVAAIPPYPNFLPSTI
jgi:hypothetical protein